MTRIIAGTSGGRRLATPPGAGTRTTSDRVREALFSRLEHLDVIEGARVLDLYAGSGALALEALSRGAVAATLVEQSAKVAQVARRNGADVAADAGRGKGGAGQNGGPVVQVRAESVRRVLEGRPEQPYGLVFLDPPYDLAEEALAADLTALVEQDWLTPDATVVVERSSRSPEPSWPVGLVAFADRKYGETRLWYAEPTDE